jgi:hypothetical protein
MRDVIIMFGLIILNGLILATMKRSLQRKRRLTTTAVSTTVGRSEQTTSRSVKSRQNSNANNSAERNVIIMVVINGANYFLGHFTSFLQYCVFNEAIVFSSCMSGLTLIVFYISYVSPLFIYFACNKLFRQYAMCGSRGRVGVRGGVSVMNERSNFNRKSQRNAA